MTAPANHTLTLRRPDDMHLHVRDGAIMQTVVQDTARHCARAIIMPNLTPPVTTVEQAEQYKQRIEKAAGSGFEALMALYLTDDTDPQQIRDAKASDAVHGVKLYPAGATTNSDSGVTALHKVASVLEVMEEEGVPLLIHGEVTDADIDIFDREKRFIDTHMLWLSNKFPKLRMVFEHITTADAVEYVTDAPAHVVATITAHHMMFDRNDMLVGGIRPHYYCLPILKRGSHRAALVEAALSGTDSFFAGTDSAPHLQGRKESACGCAGCYTALIALSLYAQAFDEAGGLHNAHIARIFSRFMSEAGAAFYGLPRNEGTVTLEKADYIVPDRVSTAEGDIIPFLAGQHLPWRVHDV